MGHRKFKKLLKHPVLEHSRFSKTNLLVFAVLFAAIGGYALYTGFAAGSGVQINLQPGSVDHTLPQYFYGVGFGAFDNGVISDPNYQAMLKGLSPEVLRLHTNNADVGTVAKPTAVMSNFLSATNLMVPNGSKILLQTTGWPSPAYFNSPNSPLDPANIDSGVFSPANMAAWVREFDRRWPGALMAFEPYNEPATQGLTNNSRVWYGPNSGAYAASPDRNAADWATAHNAQYYQAVKQADPNVKFYGGVLANVGQGSDSESARFMDGLGPAGSNIGKMDDYSFHAYQSLSLALGAPVSDQQKEANAVFYPVFSSGKSGFTAGVQNFRNELDARGGQTTHLAESEFGTFGQIGETDFGGMMDAEMAIAASRNQAAWKLDQFNYHSVSPSYVDSSGNPVVGGGGDCIVMAVTGTHNWVKSTRYLTLQNIVGPFLHNYKRQINLSTTNNPSSPAGSIGNSVPSVQVSAGLNSDGSKMGILLVNLDLTNSHPVSFDLGTAPTGTISGKYMARSANTFWNTASVASVTGLPSSLAPGDVYLLEVPIGAVTPPPADTTNPTVAITSPAAGATVSSNIQLSASAADNVGIAGVQFKVDGANLGSEITSAPYNIAWNSTAVANGPHTISAVARDAAGNTATAANVTVTVSNSTSGTVTDGQVVTMTGPATLLSDNSNVIITESSGNGHRLYPTGQVTDATIRSFIGQTVTVTGTANVSDPSSPTIQAHYPISVTSITQGGTPPPVDSIAPDVSISAPADGDIVPNSNLTISADASDNVGVAGVQFQLDGSNLGVEDLSAPYSTNLDAAALGSGGHQLTAIARDAAGNATASNPITIFINKPTKTGDLTGDGHVTLLDLSILLSHYGQNASPLQGDLSGDGKVTLIDLSILLSHYGR